MHHGVNGNVLTFGGIGQELDFTEYRARPCICELSLGGSRVVGGEAFCNRVTFVEHTKGLRAVLLVLVQ